MDEQDPVSLREVTGYTAEKYLSDEETALIRNTFKYNPQLLNIIRKIMLPTMSDPALPIEEVGRDAWLAGKKWDEIPADEAKSLIVARQDTIKFVLGGLIALKQIASQNEETDSQIAERNQRNSNK